MNRPNLPRLKNTRASAFTLVELVIVVVVIGIVAAMAVPRYAGLIARQRLDAAARRIVMDLDLARRRAKITSTSRTVTFDLIGQRYTLVGMQDPNHSAQEYQVILAEDPYQTTIVSASFGGDSQIIYDGYGAPDSGGTVVVQVGDRQKTITVDATTGAASVP